MWTLVGATFIYISIQHQAIFNHEKSTIVRLLHIITGMPGGAFIVQSEHSVAYYTSVLHVPTRRQWNEQNVHRATAYNENNWNRCTALFILQLPTTCLHRNIHVNSDGILESNVHSDPSYEKQLQCHLSFNTIQWACTCTIIIIVFGLTICMKNNAWRYNGQWGFKLCFLI